MAAWWLEQETYPVLTYCQTNFSPCHSLTHRKLTKIQAFFLLSELFSYNLVLDIYILNSVCMTFSQLERRVRVNINGENVASYSYEFLQSDFHASMFLMNSQGRNQPSHGAITDVNVWDRYKIFQSYFLS